MAVSEKFAKFSKKRPHHGFLGEIVPSTNSTEWALFLSCDLVDQASPAYGYTSNEVVSLANDVLIYADPELTTPLVPAEGSLTTFYYLYNDINSASFDCSPGDATIGNWAQCYLQWEGYTDCEGTQPVTVFTRYLLNGMPGVVFSVGMQLYTVYTSGNLESPYPYATFVTLTPTIGWEISNIGSGIITGTGGCGV